MRRRMLASCLSLLFLAAPAFAADSAAAGDSASPDLMTSAAVTTAVAQVVAQKPAAASTSLEAPTWHHATRPSSLLVLYAGSAALEAYDAYSTLHVLRLGGSEANPVMKGVVGNPAALIGIKAALTGFSILSAEHTWRSGHKVRAVVTMAISNGFMAVVAAHNASVLNSLQH